MLSAVLAKLQAFLPQMASANKELENAMKDAPAEEFDIENVDDEEQVGRGGGS